MTIGDEEYVLVSSHTKSLAHSARLLEEQKGKSARFEQRLRNSGGGGGYRNYDNRDYQNNNNHGGGGGGGGYQQQRPSK